MLKWLFIIFAAVCLSFVPIVVQAEGSGQGKSVWDNVHDTKKSDDSVTQTNNDVTDQSESGSTFFMLVKLIFMLGIVLAILFFVLKFIQKKSVSFQDGKNLQSLGGIGVGQNRSIQLIKTGNSVLVVGVGDTITLLKEVSDDAEVKLLMEQHSVQNVSTVASQLKDRLLKQKENHVKSEHSDGQTVNFKNMLNSIMSERKEERKKAEKAFEEGKHNE
ncbi:flagellar biosynthetic protein FliO [Bacillus sp. NEB1478]|uniref:flagellar biosynthetic protein FliO n=1 Tax=Bacillus sp. NEB1478 TaxID=3073816 RepID=UPI00287342F3|nr:flagellar biosynthetic protein FliO [Bacillus sp. NEB1478]WNB90391.1 flagellar biosynthetic protein FliO [Bacillus sp. NEB1478]